MNQVRFLELTMVCVGIIGVGTMDRTPVEAEAGKLDMMAGANAARDPAYFNRMAGAVNLAAPMRAAVNEQLKQAAENGFGAELVGHLVASALKKNGLSLGDQS